VAYAVTKILEETIHYGTGVAADFGRPAAGKTGTTDNHADAWFCGYTPNLEATVWVGYPRAEIPMENVHGIAVAGGTFPAQIWHLFMARALRYSPPQQWQQPSEYPVWKPFTRGRYAIQFDNSPSPSTSSTDTSTTGTATTQTTKQPAPPVQKTVVVTPRPAPPTTEPVPPPPPPPPTTEPVPPPPPPPPAPTP